MSINAFRNDFRTTYEIPVRNYTNYKCDLHEINLEIK